MIKNAEFDFYLWQIFIFAVATWLIGFISGIGARDDWKKIRRFLSRFYWR